MPRLNCVILFCSAGFYLLSVIAPDAGAGFAPAVQPAEETSALPHGSMLPHAATPANLARADGITVWQPQLLQETLVPPAIAPAQNHPANIPLPPAPSSLVLAFGALAGMGGYQATRSIRRLTSGVVPDWYQTLGPQQVGRASVLELHSMSLAPAPRLAWVFPPRADCALVTRRIERPPQMHFVSRLSPRAPPDFS